MLAQLRHPNICLFLGVCLEPPHRAIVTELVSRGSLWDCLRVKGLFQVSCILCVGLFDCNDIFVTFFDVRACSSVSSARVT